MKLVANYAKRVFERSLYSAVYASYVFLGTSAPGEPVWNTPQETWTWILNDSINFFYVNIFAKFAGLPSIPTPDVSLPLPFSTSLPAVILQSNSELSAQFGSEICRGVSYLLACKSAYCCAYDQTQLAVQKQKPLAITTHGDLSWQKSLKWRLSSETPWGYSYHSFSILLTCQATHACKSEVWLISSAVVLCKD